MIPQVLIEKFTGKNSFSLWRIKMRALLKQHGVWLPISGERPANVDEAKFKQQEEKAHSTILLSLSDEVLYEVADEESATGLWLKLESLYMTKFFTNKLLLKQRLFSLRMKEGSVLKEHLDELNSILMDLKNVELKIEDEDAALILLVSLPPSYENFVNSFVVGRDTITLEEVRSSLHFRELRLMASGGVPESQPMGLNVSSRDTGRSENGNARSRFRGKKPNPRDPCFKCGEIGHWKNECPKLKGNGSNANVTDDGSKSEYVLVLMVTSCDFGRTDEWVLDSACSFHICPNEFWFDTYQVLETGSVFMGDGARYKVVGIGSICIRMGDGVVRTLTGVRHVPGFKRNLISLGVLDLEGFKYSGSGGVLEVYKGDLVVMKGNLNESSVYVLEGETILGSVAVSGSEKLDSESARLAKPMVHQMAFPGGPEKVEVGGGFAMVSGDIRGGGSNDGCNLVAI